MEEFLVTEEPFTSSLCIFGWHLDNSRKAGLRRSPALEEFFPDVGSFLSRTSNGTLEPDSPFARKSLQSSSVECAKRHPPCTFFHLGSKQLLRLLLRPRMCV